MSRYHCYKETIKRRFYRSRARGKLNGVCAGVASYFDWELTVVRLLAVLGLIFFTIPTLLAYFLVTFLTDKL
ncbi:PspC domain-containing protein [Pleionea sediminis]|uniref:PspC domain-containing protein n=1 Tax=Pleionea sediminis TaxID=2569479 RepID=UPI0011860D0E|nr:PspC domain-containing protein [Pleionea sediminis]